jgi:hypothetical protein
LRIGINFGDVIVEGDDLYSDGVNIAARIEALADAGGVFDHVRDRLPFVFDDLGEQQVKNITRPVRVYRVGTRMPKSHQWCRRRCWRSPRSRRSPCCRSQTWVIPGEACQTDEQLIEEIRERGVSNLHPVGTCRMGREVDAVVDPRLRVHGIEGLRVADASIMPQVPGGNTNAPSIMIGEKCAAMMLEDAQEA